MARDEVLGAMREAAAGDADWKGGKTWSLVYHAGDEVTALLKDAYGMFFAQNGLSPIAFPSLRKFEAEVLAMAADLFHGADAAGAMTSGGSESVLMCVKTHRDRARALRGIAQPEMVLPVTAHPAFLKAAHYFGVKPVAVPLRADFRVDVGAVRAAINDNTALIVGSAPQYPHGVIDPIAELSALALERGVPLHVDACLGGFLLPFARKLGHPIPDFDFTLPGVASISADLHKYGFAAKGASVVLYRDRDIRRHQFFVYADWPGGLYGSPSMTGTRPGGAIAAAWAVMKFLGEEGYLKIARTILDTTRRLLDGIRAVPGLRVLGAPDMSVFAFDSETLDVYALADAMDARGWRMDRQQRPPCLHQMVTPAHERVVEPFLADLRECAGALAAGAPAPEGSAAMYGMLGAVPDRGMVDGFILEFMDGLDRLD
jgi:glutamate/tyrosine decarboxylase-like PLP-dependent enzyme